MKLVLTWQPPVMQWDYSKCKEVPSQLDRENIFLSVGIKEVSEQEAYVLLMKLETALNEELETIYGKTSFARCSGYEDTEKRTLYDFCGWKRDFGNVAEQKKEIMQTARSVFKKIMLEEN